MVCVLLRRLLKHNPSGLDFLRSRPRVHPTFPHDPNFVVPEGVPLKLATFYEFLQHRLLDNKPFLPSHGSSSSLLSSSSSGGSSTDLAGAGGTSDGPVGATRVTFDLMVDTSDSILRSHRFKLPVGGAHEVQVRRVEGDGAFCIPEGCKLEGQGVVLEEELTCQSCMTISSSLVYCQLQHLWPHCVCRSKPYPYIDTSLVCRCLPGTLAGHLLQAWATAWPARPQASGWWWCVVTAASR